MDSTGKRGHCGAQPGSSEPPCSSFPKERHRCWDGKDWKWWLHGFLPEAETSQAKASLGPPEMFPFYAETGLVVIEGGFCNLEPIVSMPCPHSTSTSCSASSFSCPGWDCRHSKHPVLPSSLLSVKDLMLSEAQTQERLNSSKNLLPLLLPFCRQILQPPVSENDSGDSVPRPVLGVVFVTSGDGLPTCFPGRTLTELVCVYEVMVWGHRWCLCSWKKESQLAGVWNGPGVPRNRPSVLLLGNFCYH